MPIEKKHYQVLIIGGGTGGIWTAAKLSRENPHLDIGIIEPSKDHYYQPAWTLVGAGTYDIEDSRRDMKSVIPYGVDWIQDKAMSFDPKNNKVTTAKNGSYTYDYLVVAVGVQYDYSLIEGLEEAFEKGVVCSNYIDPEYTWECIQNFKGGNALFTQPNTPIKCAGAPQKAAYLMADYLLKESPDKDYEMIYAAPVPAIIGVKEIAKTLMKVIERYNIQFGTFYAQVKINADKKIAYFKNITPKGEEQTQRKLDLNRIGASEDKEGLISVPFDFLHIAPPQVAPDAIRNSELANKEGWLEVHDHSLQHLKYDNVFGIGDVAGIPNVKSGSAIKFQVPVVVDNILKLQNNQKADNLDYQGYSACPVVTGYKKAVLAEFDYENNFTPDPNLKKMLVFNSAKEHWRLWLLKKYGLPYMYWTKMLTGEM